MRFRCPNYRQVLELTQYRPTLLCPACERWCRIPIPDEFELNGGPALNAPTPSPRAPVSKKSSGQYSEGVPLRSTDEVGIEKARYALLKPKNRVVSAIASGGMIEWKQKIAGLQAKGFS